MKPALRSGQTDTGLILFPLSEMTHDCTVAAARNCYFLCVVAIS